MRSKWFDTVIVTIGIIILVRLGGIIYEGLLVYEINQGGLRRMTNLAPIIGQEGTFGTHDQDFHYRI